MSARYGPNVAEFLQAKEREGEPNRTPDEWNAFYDQKIAEATATGNARLAAGYRSGKGLLQMAMNRDAELPPDDGELYTHTLRDETEEEAEAREREEEARAVAEVRRQRQRNALLDPEARAALEQQLAPIVTIPLFEGQTPATPFRIAVHIDIELSQHASVYKHGRLHQFARPLLERWFAEHPSDPLPQSVRMAIAAQAERAANKEKARMRAEIAAEQSAVQDEYARIVSTAINPRPSDAARRARELTMHEEFRARMAEAGVYIQR